MKTVKWQFHPENNSAGCSWLTLFWNDSGRAWGRPCCLSTWDYTYWRKFSSSDWVLKVFWRLEFFICKKRKIHSWFWWLELWTPESSATKIDEPDACHWPVTLILNAGTMAWHCHVFQGTCPSSCRSCSSGRWSPLAGRPFFSHHRMPADWTGRRGWALNKTQT